MVIIHISRARTRFQLQTVYVDGMNSTTLKSTLNALVLEEGQVGSVTLVDPQLDDGNTHTVKLIGVDNTQISFAVKK